LFGQRIWPTGKLPRGHYYNAKNDKNKVKHHLNCLFFN
jgi:hypothetical protein